MKKTFRNLCLLALLAAAGLYGLVALRGPGGWPALSEKRRQVRELQEQNASLAADNLRKRERIRLLKDNPNVQGDVIRERLKLLRPGETQFILPNSTKEPAVSPKTPEN